MKVLYMEDAVANLKDTDISPGKLIIAFQTTSFQTVVFFLIESTRMKRRAENNK